jgi:hypothetical protein
MRVTIDTNRGMVINPEGDSYIYGLSGRKPKWVTELENGAIEADQAEDLAKIKTVAKERLSGTMTCPTTGKVHTFGRRGRPPLWVTEMLAAGVLPSPATQVQVLQAEAEDPQNEVENESQN